MRGWPGLVIALGAGAGAGAAACGSDGPPGGFATCDGVAAAGDAPEWVDVIGQITVAEEYGLGDGPDGLMRFPLDARAAAVLAATAFPELATSVFVRDAVTTMTEGDCRLRENVPAQCDPPCAGTGLCVPPGVCNAQVERSAGAIAIGVGGGDLVELAPPVYEMAIEPGAADGCAAIEAVAAGADGDLPAFTVAAAAVAALDVGIVDVAWQIEDDRDARLTWTPTSAHARMRLQLVSPNRGHGSPARAILECDVADARGELVVPRALIAAMPPSHDDYCAGYDCPDSRLIRYHRGTAIVADGTIALYAASALDFRVVHNPEQAE